MPRAPLLLCAALVALVSLAPRAPLLVFNPSPSVPVGFYLRVGEVPRRGDFVTVRAREVAFAYARTRNFVDDNDRFIKRVAAASGDEICAEDDRIHLNGVLVARRSSHDSAGRALPRWEGCQRLQRDELLLLGDTDDSFDGRYWGAIDGANVEAVWRPLRLVAY